MLRSCSRLACLTMALTVGMYICIDSAFVDAVGDTMDQIDSKLNEGHYSTKTRGERTVGACRIMGEAAYDIIDEHGHVHVAYVLDIPEQPTEVQKAFRIEKEGNFLVTIRVGKTSPFRCE